MNVWERLNEMISEVERDEIGWNTPIHPQLQKNREQVKKTLDWVADGLDKNGTPQMKRIAQTLRKIHSLPSDQVLPTLKAANDELHSAKRDFGRVNPAGQKAVKDALMGIPSVMKAAASLGKGNSSDDGLWQRKLSGYTDNETGNFSLQKITDFPTGMDFGDTKPPSIPPVNKIPSSTKVPTKTQSVAPMVRKAADKPPSIAPLVPKKKVESTHRFPTMTKLFGG